MAIGAERLHEAFAIIIVHFAELLHLSRIQIQSPVFASSNSITSTQHFCRLFADVIRV